MLLVRVKTIDGAAVTCHILPAPLQGLPRVVFNGALLEGRSVSSMAGQRTKLKSSRDHCSLRRLRRAKSCLAAR